MSLIESPLSNGKNMLELKGELDAFISEHSITQFESEDIIELIQEGEDLDWIAEQLKSNSPEAPMDALLKLMGDIRQMTGPAEKPGAEASDFPTDEAPEKQEAVEAALPDLSGFDPSTLDLSKIADMLPEGMQLPAGVDMKQIGDMLASPQGKIMSDFILFCSEKGIELNEEMMEDPGTEALQNEWKSTPREAFGGKTPEEVMGSDPGGFLPEKIKTFRHEEPRIGRNDPCPCGSGKKFKKCCGR